MTSDLPHVPSHDIMPDLSHEPVHDDTASSLPLHGTRILDMTRLLPGAVCTMLLQQMGAEVIKIEDTGAGDYARLTLPLVDGVGAFFRASNRNKKSITLNLKEAAGREALYRLVKTSDALLEGFRPGVAARLGADAARLHAHNPALVYVSLSGWGQTGPYADEAGHDLNYVSRAGLPGAMKQAQPLGGQIADVGGAYAAALAVTSGLLQARASGIGPIADISLFESALPFSLYSITEALTAASHNPRGLTGGAAFYDCYRTRDGVDIAFAPIEAQFWANFCHAAGRPEWLGRQLHDQTVLRRDLATMFASRTADEWDALLLGADCCYSRVVPPQAVVSDPHLRQRQTMAVDDAGVPWLRSPVRFGQPAASGEQVSPPAASAETIAADDSAPDTTSPDMATGVLQLAGLPRVTGDAPTQGQHNHEILHELGYTDDELNYLESRGIVKQG